MWLLTEHSRELAEVLEDYLGQEDSVEIARRNLEAGNVPLTSSWAGLANEVGLAGLTVPEEFGGGGGTLVDGAVSQFVFGKKSAPAPLLSSLLAAQVLNDMPESAAREDVYEQLVAGQIVTISPLLVTGVSVGESDEHTYGLDVTVQAVLDADIAETLLLLLPEDVGVSVVKVDLSQTGATTCARASWSGTRSYGDIRMENVEGQRLGRLSTTEFRRFHALTRTFLAAERLGGAFSCIEMAVEYAKTRSQFDRLIGTFQGVKHPLADLYVQIHIAQAQLQQTLKDLSRARDASTESALIASILCEKSFKDAAALNIDVHGGMGYTWEHNAHIYFRRAHSDTELIGSASDNLQLMQTLLKVGS